MQEVNEMLRRTRESRERAAAAAQADQSIEEVDGVMVEEEEPPPPPQFDMSRFDQPDHKIDLQGHIVGMTLSQDQK